MRGTLVIIVLALTSFFLLLFIYTKIVGPIPFQINNINTNKTDTFNVTGEGTATVKPDLAILTAGISANGPTVKGVQAQINIVSAQISANLKKLGIEDKDMKTTNYSIYPNYDYKTGTQKIISYQASSTLTIKVRNLDLINSVIDESTNGGANQVSNIQFSVEDKTKAEDEARAKAVIEAKQKAAAAAKAADFKLGRIINYSENFNDQRPIPVYASAMGGAVEKSDTQIQPGSSEIKISVTLSYEIR